MPVFLDLADQFVVATVKGRSLDCVHGKHIDLSHITDGEYLLLDFFSHLNPPPSVPGQSRRGHSIQSHFSYPRGGSWSNRCLSPFRSFLQAAQRHRTFPEVPPCSRLGIPAAAAPVLSHLSFGTPPFHGSVLNCRRGYGAGFSECPCTHHR